MLYLILIYGRVLIFTNDWGEEMHVKSFSQELNVDLVMPTPHVLEFECLTSVFTQACYRLNFGANDWI